MSLQIADAQLTDLSDIVRLNGIVQSHHARLLPEFFRSDWASSDLEAMWRRRLEQHDGTVTVAKVDRRAVGYVWFRVQERQQTALGHPCVCVNVHHIAVDDPSRRAGVGTRLLGRAELEAKRLGISTVMLDVWAANTAAREFFRSTGYEALNIVLSKLVTLS